MGKRKWKMIFGYLGILLISGSAFSQSTVMLNIESNFTDSVSVIPYLITDKEVTPSFQKVLSVTAAEKELILLRDQKNAITTVNALLGVSDAFIAYGQHKKAFYQLKRILSLKGFVEDENTIAHIYYDMAVIMARSGNYLLALSCYYKAGNLVPQFAFKKKRKWLLPVDSSFRLLEAEPFFQSEPDTTEDPVIFSDSAMDAKLALIDTLQLTDKKQVVTPLEIDPDTLLNAFYDHKKAISYAVAIHIKQPLAGKKKVFVKMGDVGHMFISLMKFNEDGSVITKTFGFYPQKGILFSANPLFPSATGVMKNDAERNWDEMIGKFISRNEFEKIISFVEDSADKNYHLSKFNCSDFALGIANLANIQINETSGHWPLGKGNNPGFAGQSILSGKFFNKDTNSFKGLFACTNNLFASGN